MGLGAVSSWPATLLRRLASVHLDLSWEPQVVKDSCDSLGVISESP